MKETRCLEERVGGREGLSDGTRALIGMSWHRESVSALGKSLGERAEYRTLSPKGSTSQDREGQRTGHK